MSDGKLKMTTIYVNDDTTTAKVHYQHVPQNLNTMPSGTAVVTPKPNPQHTQQVPKDQTTPQNTNG